MENELDTKDVMSILRESGVVNVDKQGGEPEKNEPEENGLPRLLIVSEETRQILINLYAPLLAMERNDFDDVNAYAASISSFLDSAHSEQYKNWSISDTGKRLKCYELDTKPTGEYGVRMQDEWMDGIKSWLLADDREVFPENTYDTFAWWEGLTDDEKLAISTLDLVVWSTFFDNYREENRPEYNYQTTDYVKIYCPCFGCTSNPRYDDEDDMTKPLPFELLKRISDYIVNRFMRDGKEQLLREIRGVNNFNRFIREKIEDRWL